MMTTNKARFHPGHVLTTCGALEILQRNQCSGLPFLKRHLSGDWGELPTEDWEANDEALKTGARLMSVYQLADGSKLWIVTEAVDASGQRSATTLLLPDDY